MTVSRCADYPGAIARILTSSTDRRCRQASDGMFRVPTVTPKLPTVRTRTLVMSRMIVCWSGIGKEGIRNGLRSSSFGLNVFQQQS